MQRQRNDGSHIQRKLMFSFLLEDTFYVWLTVGAFSALLGGFGSMSRGSFFRAIAGMVFTNICLLGALGVVVKIGISEFLLRSLSRLLHRNGNRWKDLSPPMVEPICYATA